MKVKSIFRYFFLFFVSVLVFNTNLLSQTTVVKGKLLDVEGKPSQFALVGIAESPNANGKDFVNCDANGNYSINITKPGVNFIMYSLPNHRALKVPVNNNKAKGFEIDVTLAPYKYKDNFDDIGLSGPFNNYNIQSPKKMLKGEDGLYTLEIKSDQKEFSYQLCNIEIDGRSINAPGSKIYKPDFSGDYFSVAEAVDGKVKIVFDPSKLLKKETEYKVKIKGSEYEEKLFQYFDELSKVSTDYMAKRKAYAEAQKDPKLFQYDHGNYFVEFLSKIDSEKDPELKNILELIYVSFATYKAKDYNTEKAALFYGSISPENSAWDFVPDAFYGYYQLLPSDKWNDHLDKFLKFSKNNYIKTSIISNKLVTAQMTGNSAELKRLRGILETEFKDVQIAKDILNMYPADIKIILGAEIPDFEVVSINDTNVIYSKQSMLGKIYMIDFWATWCGPCVGEMETLHKAYEKFKDKGFNIVSLSMDSKVEDVVKFRNAKWKMPWLNSFIGPMGTSKIANNFEVIGIPKPILVGADGKILAMDEAMRGANLELTLAKYFK